ncbi:MAG: hypothetical protein WD773_03615 [Gemmatimonadales bacterium]
MGRVLYFTHAEYAEKWQEIAAIFSRDAVLQGAFDKFAEAKRPKRGSLPVDEAFLKEIEGWREALAKNIAARNPKLDVREINFAVQRIIDRIIFLRIAEDRGIEPYGRLQGLLNGKNMYARLFELFERADDRYNSGLFHFKEEKGRAERPDELTPRLKVDDDPLQDIIGDLYLPKSAKRGHGGAPRADRITVLVLQVLQLAPRAERATTEGEREGLLRQITAIDRQIDQLVYELYGLTDEEIRIVEEAMP